MKWRSTVQKLKKRLEPDIYKTYLALEALGEEATRSQNLARLMRDIPARFTADLALTSLTLFIHDETSYCVRHQQGDLHTPDVRFGDRSSTVSHLKRTLKPSRVDLGHPAPWIFLATAEDVASLNILGAQLILPFPGKRGLPGFAVLRRRPKHAFTPLELTLLNRFALLMGQSLEAALTLEALLKETTQRERVTRELELAREVQERLLPQVLPNFSNVSISGRCKSADRVGGDYFDVFATEDGRLCYAIGDVSGKGISAALLMATLRACLRSLMLHPEAQLTEIMRQLNKLIFESSSSSRYATFFVGVLQPSTNEFTYVNCGHNPPLLIEGPKITRLQSGGSVLGLFDDGEYQQATLTLHPGAMLVAYTDGFSEATDAAGEEWGEDGLILSLTSSPTQTTAEKMREAFEAVDLFSKGAHQQDDMTLLIMQREEIRPEVN